MVPVALTEVAVNSIGATIRRTNANVMKDFLVFRSKGDRAMAIEAA